MTTDLYNLKREKVGTVELPDSLFGVRWNEAVVKQVLDAQTANARIPWSSAKTRAEVRGGGRKPWRQKGTGRARHGSTRSPIWVGGGKAHGPLSERSYEQKVNKKVRRKAIGMVLSRKLKDGELTMVDALTLSAPKTNLLASALRKLVSMSKAKKNYDALLVPKTEEKKIVRAGANLLKTKVAHPGSLNIYDLLNHKHLVMDQAAAVELARHYRT